MMKRNTRYQEIMDPQTWADAFTSLQSNFFRIFGTIIKAGWVPKIMRELRKRNSAFLFYMPTPPRIFQRFFSMTRPLASGIKIHLGRGVTRPLDLVFGSNRGEGSSLFGLGITGNRNTQSANRSMFRMDFGRMGTGSHRGDYDVWPDGRFHYHVENPPRN